MIKEDAFKYFPPIVSAETMMRIHERDQERLSELQKQYLYAEKKFEEYKRIAIFEKEKCDGN